MKIQEEKKNDVVVLLLDGEININTSPELRKRFAGCVEAKEKKVLLDFGSVTYLDSSGLATLIEVAQRLKKIGGRMRFCRVNERVRSVFEITKLINLFEIFEDQTLALKGF